MDELQNIIARSLCSVADEIEEPEYLIEYNGIGVMPIEGLVAIKGKAKNGKSQAVTLLMAATLGDKSFGFSQRDVAENSKVIFIDTEQSKAETILLGRRLHALLNWDEKTSNERISFYNVRNEDHSIRLYIIENIIEQNKPSLVVIDGIADLVADINSSIEAPKCVGQLLALSSKYHCCIMAVIHENKGQDDKAMRGHLGTWLLNKSSDIFAVKKDKQQTSETFSLTHEDSRGQTIEQVKWQREGEKLISLVQPSVNLTEARLRPRFNGIFGTNEELTKDDLKAAYQKLGLAISTLNKDVAEAVKAGILESYPNPQNLTKSIYKLKSTNYNF